VKIFYEPNDISIEADKDRLNQVIFNLLNNAIKFTKDGTVLVRTKIKGTNNNQKLVVVSVKDPGSGIEHEILPKLFSKFTSKSDKGTGLGLYI